MKKYVQGGLSGLLPVLAKLKIQTVILLNRLNCPENGMTQKISNIAFLYFDIFIFFAFVMQVSSKIKSEQLLLQRKKKLNS